MSVSEGHLILFYVLHYGLERPKYISPLFAPCCPQRRRGSGPERKHTGLAVQDVDDIPITWSSGRFRLGIDPRPVEYLDVKENTCMPSWVYDCPRQLAGYLAA